MAARAAVTGRCSARGVTLSDFDRTYRKHPRGALESLLNSSIRPNDNGDHVAVSTRLIHDGLAEFHPALFQLRPSCSHFRSSLTQASHPRMV